MNRTDPTGLRPGDENFNRLKDWIDEDPGERGDLAETIEGTGNAYLTFVDFAGDGRAEVIGNRGREGHPVRAGGIGPDAHELRGRQVHRKDLPAPFEQVPEASRHRLVYVVCWTPDDGTRVLR